MPFDNRKFSIVRFVMILALLVGMLGMTPVHSAHANTIIVTNTGDSGPGSLRQAILSAVSGDTITFDPALAGGTITLSSELFIEKNLTIDGSGLNPRLALSGGYTSRIMWISVNAQVTISDLEFALGSSAQGGAILVDGNANLTLKNSTFYRNEASPSGGAISVDDNGILIVLSSTLYQNWATVSGGAIFLDGNAQALVVNSTIANNLANGGGGIFTFGDSLMMIVNSTIAHNAVEDRSEVLIQAQSGIVLYNTQVACIPENTKCVQSQFSSGLTLRNSFASAGTLASFGLAELADNGGPTQTMALLPDSPLIDAGDDSICADSPVANLDQRGVSRPQGAHCDIGAYEDQDLVRYVKQDAAGAGDGSSWSNAHTDLQSALAAATPDEEIWVAAGTYKPTTGADRTISIALKTGVAIYGGFAGTEASLTQRDYEMNLTVLSGDIGVQNDNSDNSYHVLVGSNTNNSALLDGFTVTAGNANGEMFTQHQAQGGGLYNETGSPSIKNVIFTNNYAHFGGGMHSAAKFEWEETTTPVLTNVRFINNSAVEGGGMRNSYYSSPILTDVIFDGNSVIRSGGGLGNGYYSHPTLTNVIFSNNTAGDLGVGGGMMNWVDCNPMLTNVTFSGNTAQSGGGMSNYQSSPTLTNVTLSANVATGPGGGMFNESYSSPTLTDVVLSTNIADTGSGIFDLDGSSPDLNNVIFRDNAATWYGGGMANENNSNPTLTNVVFDGNIAADTEQTAAGGMHNRSSSPSLRNVTFKNNSANYLGGGMVNEAGSSPDLVNVTFSHNSAAYGGAMLNRDVNSNPTLTHVTISDNTASIEGGALANAGNLVIRNSILWGNDGGEIFQNGLSVPVIAHSIVQGGYPGTGNLDEDPLLGPLQDNGGFTQTMALGAGSPAIDVATDVGCPNTDQRGVSRPQGAHCDIGAYEDQDLVRYVKQDAAGTGDGSSWSNAHMDLQSALAAAAPDEEIWVAAGTYKPTSGTDRTISFVLRDGVALYGGFAGTETSREQRDYQTNLTVLSGDIGLEADNSDNSYHVVVGNQVNHSAILDGFTVTAGNADDTTAFSPHGQGGGMYLSHGSPVIRNATFVDNAAKFGGGMFDGGTFGFEESVSYPILTNVIFQNNSATEGGGLFTENYVHVTLTDVTFDGNTATRAGGGMEDRLGSLSLTNVEFKNNVSDGAAGGIQIFSLAASLTNVTFSGNSAVFGGGIINANVDSTLTNVTFQGNVAEAGGGMWNHKSDATLMNVNFIANIATDSGGGMYNEENSNPTLTDVTFSGNTAQSGGGMSNYQSSPTLTNVTLSANVATGPGGGMHNENSSPRLTNVIFTDNSAPNGGGMHNLYGTPTLTNVTFQKNGGTSYGAGGGMTNNNSAPILTNVTFSENLAGEGGAVYNYYGNTTLTNVTFSHNSAQLRGGGMFNAESSPGLTNVTFSGNTSMAGAIFNDENSNPTIVNSILYGDTGGEIVNNSGAAIVTYSIVQGGYTGDGNLDEDPLLGPLQDNGGFTQTMALGAGSPAIDVGTNVGCPNTDQRGVSRPQGSQCDIGAYEYEGLESAVSVSIGASEYGPYWLAPQESRRISYPGVNSGPVKVVNTDGVATLAAERVVYRVNNLPTSFSEMMGLPASQLDTIYWLPWYNNKELNTQLRFANVSDTEASVHVYIGGVEMSGSPYSLAPGASTRKSYAGIDKGPVKIESDVPIVAAERVIYRVNGVDTSYSEMMALPDSQLDTTYWLPWYNNKELNTQLRFANVSDTEATVHVYIGGVEMTGSPFTLQPGQSTRKSFPNIDKGPVQIESNVPIVAAERVIYKVNGVNTSFSEMMALPNTQLDTTYRFPWYNNKDLNTQLRFANVSESDAIVHVYIGGVEMTGSPFTLLPGQSIRRSFPGIDKGPVEIKSDVPIVAAERVIYNVNGTNISFSEMMGLPDHLLDVAYWFPWYNNVELNTQLRFGVP